MKNLEGLALTYKRAQNQIADGMTNITREDLAGVLNSYDSKKKHSVPIYIVENRILIKDRLSGLPTNVQIQRFDKNTLASVMLDIDGIKDKQSLYDLFDGIQLLAGKDKKTALYLGLVASTENGLELSTKLRDIPKVSDYTMSPQNITLAG